jgi:hypothetical protein
MTSPTCLCGAPATHEDLSRRSTNPAEPVPPVYLCRHAVLSRDPKTIRRLTSADCNMTPEEEATAARLAREARKAARR